jgi:hypothetical protein
MSEKNRIIDGKILKNQNLTTPEERVRQIFIHRKFHMTSIGLKSGLYHERPAPKRLSYDKRN